MKKLTHILDSRQFSREWLENELFPLAKEMEKIAAGKKKVKILKNKEMVSFFYEASTRTRMSFEIAMRKLGGTVVFSTENAKEFSSVAKGEKIEDTIRVICGYHPDVIVLRTDEEGMAERAAQYSNVPIINAGDGVGQHPTQAALDLYTIQERLGKITGTWTVLAGDLNRSRVIRSFIYLYAKFPDVKISLISPETARIKKDVRDYLVKHNAWFEEIYDLREVAGKADIIMSTRIQRERGGDILLNYGPPSFWKINQEVLDLMKKDAIIMHPLPHLDEIAPEVDKDPRTVYFRQAENGLYVRMALLKMILK